MKLLFLLFETLRACVLAGTPYGYWVSPLDLRSRLGII